MQASESPPCFAAGRRPCPQAGWLAPLLAAYGVHLKNKVMVGYGGRNVRLRVRLRASAAGATTRQPRNVAPLALRRIVGAIVHRGQRAACQLLPPPCVSLPHSPQHAEPSLSAGAAALCCFVRGFPFCCWRRSLRTALPSIGQSNITNDLVSGASHSGQSTDGQQPLMWEEGGMPACRKLQPLFLVAWAASMARFSLSRMGLLDG